MPRIIPFRLAAVCLLALSLTLAFAAGASAKGFSADLRVVGAGGKVLAEKTVPSADVSVKTSPKATCFGPGTGGSGDSVALKGNTAMGLLASGAKTIPALRPLSISDSLVSPIAKPSNVTLQVRESEIRAFRSLSASMCLAQALVIGFAFEASRKEEARVRRRPKS